MKLATFGFLVSAIVFGGYLLDRVSMPLGMIALGVCLACVVVQLVSMKERRKP